MFNILYDLLPEEWEEYSVNTWFQVGIQIYVVMEDEEINEYEKNDILIALLFGNEDGTIREHPQRNDLKECLEWFLNGWNYDNPAKKHSSQRVMDFTKDQWRIYSDFRAIYGINLNESDMHWWEFSALLWNMPYEQSQFMQVVNLRKKEIDPKLPAKEKQRLQEAKQIYAISQPPKEYTKEEESMIDEYDRMMEEARKRKKELSNGI